MVWGGSAGTASSTPSSPALHDCFRLARGGHFTVLFEGPAEEDAAVAAVDILEGAYARIGDFLQTYPRAPIAVVLYTQAAYAEQTGHSRIAQRVTLPAGLDAPTLSFFYLLDGASPTSRSSLSVQVVTGSGSTTVFSTSDSANSWTHRWFDLSTWAGQTITLTLNVQQTANHLCTWGYLVEVTIGGAYPDHGGFSPG